MCFDLKFVSCFFEILRIYPALLKKLVPTFILENCRKQVFEGKFTASTMFIDLSGFTPLTESLMREGSAGAERLSDILNDIFSPMVELVHKNG